MSGTLIIITAASGTGKTTLVHSLCERLDNLKVSISCTTRPKRPGEMDGVDYHFIDEKRFQEMVADNLFLEHELVFDHHYGTPRKWVEDELHSGNDVILEIDWQGARDIRRLMPEQSISIFILPPSFATLEKRLRGRGQDSDETIRRRMQDNLEELSHYREFDYLVVNASLESALQELVRIVESRRKGIVLQAADLNNFAEQVMTEGRQFQ